jgi:hypothetical protein
VLLATLSQSFSPRDSLSISTHQDFVSAAERDESLSATNNIFLIRVDVGCLEIGCQEKIFSDWPTCNSNNLKWHIKSHKKVQKGILNCSELLYCNFYFELQKCGPMTEEAPCCWFYLICFYTRILFLCRFQPWKTKP